MDGKLILDPSGVWQCAKDGFFPIMELVPESDIELACPECKRVWMLTPILKEEVYGG